MTPQTLFYIIIAILVINFIIDQVLDALNAKHFNDDLPAEIDDVYDETEYKKSQAYKKEKYRFGLITGFVSIVGTLLFFFLDGFAYVDGIARSVSDNEILVALLFFGIILFASDIIMTPFSYYNTFVIEEKFGFNKTTKTTFFLDKLKGWFMMAIIGDALLSAIIWFYQSTGSYFWLWA